MRAPDTEGAPAGSPAVLGDDSRATESTAWGKGDLWRLSRSSAANPSIAWDQAVGAKVSWQWDTDLLSIAPLGKDTPRTHDIALGRNDMAIDFGILHAGVLHAPILARVQLRPKLDSSGGWTLEHEFESPPGVRFLVRASGTFDATSGLGTVDQSSLQNLTRGQTEPFAWSRASGWRPSWVSGLSIASSVEYVDRSAPTHSVYELVSVTRIADEDISLVTAAPSLDRPDPVRGAFKQGRFEDFRGSEPGVAIVESGRVVAVESGDVPAPAAARSAVNRLGVALLTLTCLTAGTILVSRWLKGRKERSTKCLQ